MGALKWLGEVYKVTPETCWEWLKQFFPGRSLQLNFQYPLVNPDIIYIEVTLNELAKLFHVFRYTIYAKGLLIHNGVRQG